MNKREKHKMKNKNFQIIKNMLDKHKVFIETIPQNISLIHNRIQEILTTETLHQWEYRQEFNDRREEFVEVALLAFLMYNDVNVYTKVTKKEIKDGRYKEVPQHLLPDFIFDVRNRSNDKCPILLMLVCKYYKYPLKDKFNILKQKTCPMIIGEDINYLNPEDIYWIYKTFYIHINKKGWFEVDFGKSTVKYQTLDGAKEGIDNYIKNSLKFPNYTNLIK